MQTSINFIEINFKPKKYNYDWVDHAVNPNTVMT